MVRTCLLASHCSRMAPTQPGMVLPTENEGAVALSIISSHPCSTCFSLQSSGALRTVQLLATQSKAANSREGAAQPALCRALVFPCVWRRQTLCANESGPVQGCVSGNWTRAQTSRVYPQNRPWLDWVKRLIPSKKKVFVWQGMVVVFEMKMAQGKNRLLGWMTCWLVSGCLWNGIRSSAWHAT